MLKFLRMFLDDDKGDGKGGGGDTPVPANTPPADELKYSDKMLNDLIAKNAGKEAQKMLAAAGIKDLSELQELAKLKSAPTTPPADDPLKKELEEVKKTTGELICRADTNEAIAIAMKSGVLDEAKLERVVKLALSPAYDGTVKERIQKVVAEFPETVSQQGQAFGTEHKNDAKDETESMLDKARAAAGLPPRK